MTRRIAIVTPWYGPEAVGGAENLARELATHLAATDQVTIVTTTGRSFQSDWSLDHFAAGRTREHGHDVLRFPLADRDVAAFDALNGELMQLPRELWAGLYRQRFRTDAFIEESITSPAMERYLRGREAARYDAVVFLPYLYGVVVRGIEAFPGRAHLLPCLHDESYARIPRIEDAVHRAATLLFNSDGEAELALRLYGPGILHKSHVIGSGIPPANGAVGSAGVDGEYFLFLGRRDATKGLDFLVEAYSRYRGDRSGRHSLVLAGPGSASYHDPARGIIDLGFVDEGTKLGLIRRARALVQPSVNESYSRVLMEAWREGVAVIARADCLATATAVRRSGGGIIAEGIEDWTDAFARLGAASRDELAEFGTRGSAYAAAHADWPRVIERFRQATGLDAPAKAPRLGKRIDQVTQALAFGDAISDEVRFLRARLEQSGYDSVTHARFIDPLLGAEATVLSPTSMSGAHAVIYHHSIAFDDIDILLSADIPKALIYHNITPPDFFRDHDERFAELLERGRAQLAGLANEFEAAGGDSEFNTSELRALGFRNARVLPLAVNLARFDVTPSALYDLGNGARWLCVGRISPNKGIRPLLEAFEVYLSIDPAARLTLVGSYSGADPYYQDLSRFVLEHSLGSHVTFAGRVDEAGLTAYYRNADVYVCLSEHEGFCVPLVEAMYFDVPIIARTGTAITETLGDAGILIDAETDAFDIAAIAREIVCDDALRGRIIESQRARRPAFLPERVFPVLDALVSELT